MAEEMRAMSREGRAQRLVEPDEMVAPLLYGVSREADKVNGWRFDANLWDPSLPPAEAARRPVSRCTRSRADGAGPSLLWETGLAQAGVERLLGEDHEWRIGVPRAFCAPLCQRTDLRFQLDRLRQCRPRLLEITLKCRRSRKPKMYKEQSRIRRACLAKERYRIVQAAGYEVR
jgi:hypothetical protein